MGFLDKVGGALGAVFPTSVGLSSLLGGSLGGALGGGQGNNTQTITNLPWNAEQLEWLQTQAKQQYEDGPQKYYPDSTVAPMNPELQATLNKLMNFGNQPGVQAGQDALSQALTGMSGLQDRVAGEQVSGVGDYASFLMNQGIAGGGGRLGAIADGTDPTSVIQQFLGGSATNPYTDQLVQNVTSDLNENLNENILPQVRRGALANNAYGGSRQGIAEGRAIEGTQEAIGDASARIRQGAAESDLNRQMQAAGLSTNVAAQGDQYQQMLQQLGLSGANMGRGLFQDLAGITGQNAALAPLSQAFEGMNLSTQQQAGTAQQQYLQSLLNDKVNRHNFEQGADQQNLANYANILFGAGGMGGTETRTQTMPEASLIERLLGGGATGLGAYGMASAAGIPFAGPLAIAMGGLSALS